jgi:hypothetical protein
LKYHQCFICREWSWDVSRVLRKHVELCLPCYVDVLEVRQARGLMGEPLGGSQKVGLSNPTPEATIPGQSPSPFTQLDLFFDAWPGCPGSVRGSQAR